MEGILLIDKPKRKTSFSLVSTLRKRLGIKKIGHAGTLDPLATGLMVMLIGRAFTRKSQHFLMQDKEYLAEVHLGIATETYDSEGVITHQSPFEPTPSEIERIITQFQGNIEQIPPMFSAKKVQGKKLYELARQGKQIPRRPIQVHVRVKIVSYNFPKLYLWITCSKGTYVRSLAHDIGAHIGCHAHLSNLQRIRCGPFHLKDSYPGDIFSNNPTQLKENLIHP